MAAVSDNLPAVKLQGNGNEQKNNLTATNSVYLQAPFTNTEVKNIDAIINIVMLKLLKTFSSFFAIDFFFIHCLNQHAFYLTACQQTCWNSHIQYNVIQQMNVHFKS